MDCFNADLQAYLFAIWHKNPTLFNLVCEVVKWLALLSVQEKFVATYNSSRDT